VGARKKIKKEAEKANASKITGKMWEEKGDVGTERDPLKKKRRERGEQEEA